MQPSERATEQLLAACRQALPSYMVPMHVEWSDDSLPRNANGKIDRPALAAQFAACFEEVKR
jgi:acyl-coenzyme A synthetase/AMP-(fatty) acid ligase